MADKVADLLLIIAAVGLAAFYGYLFGLGLSLFVMLAGASEAAMPLLSVTGSVGAVLSLALWSYHRTRGRST